MHVHGAATISFLESSKVFVTRVSYSQRCLTLTACPCPSSSPEQEEGVHVEEDVGDGPHAKRAPPLPRHVAGRGGRHLQAQL